MRLLASAKREARLLRQVVLPSLDRLAGLIERVVELVDEVAGGRAAGSNNAPAPLPPARAAALSSRRRSRRRSAKPAVASSLPLSPAGSPSSRRRTGTRSSRGRISLPILGAVLELDGASFRVLRYAPSPLPGDRRRCAVVAREEPPEPDRTFDA